MAIYLNNEKLTGTIIAGMSNIVPDGYLLCDGSAISRTVYSNLFQFSPKTISIVTMTIANPCVVTWTNHGLATGHSIQFTTTGSLPTGVTAGTVYYIDVVSVNTFYLYDSLSNAILASGTGRVISSGSQSGNHTATVYYWGNGNGSTTFNIPDSRGVVLRGSGTSSAFVCNATIRVGEKTNDAFYVHNHGGGNHGHNIYEGGGGAGDSENATDSEPLVDNFWRTQNSGTIISSQGDSIETKVKSIGVNYFIKY